MKKLILSAAMMLAAGFGFSQGQNFWKSSSANLKNRTSASVIAKTNMPQAFKVYELDMQGLKAQLRNAQDREVARGTSNLMISIPNAEGSFENFKIVEADVLHPQLAAKYPGIKSYAGTSMEDPTATIRFSVSQAGFHAMVLSSQKGTYYIDPYTTDKSSYMVYARKDLAGSEQPFECLTPEDKDLPSMSDEGGRVMNTNDKKLRRYRLAMSCNAEYGNIFAGSSGTDAQKKANILAQMNITMTRVNGIYERDLAITMQLVPNNDLIIYYGSTTSDPWSNEWNSKTQQVIDAAIGNANYDIGHNFNTTGGGNAGCIGCVCTTGSKGSGYTGRSDPTGDAFDVDYVAHEMGHQFGGYHTMNTCSRSGSGSTEVEPASGSSIMGYAGICSTNIQANSDAYFAYVNIRDISANVKTGVSSACAQIVNLTNNAPTANAGLDYTIPKSTAFVLKGAGSDPDGDALTYTWEQNDPAQAPGNGSPVSTWTVGPMFRSKTGTSSPDRYMPQISDVVNNNLTPTWEVIPSVARTLNFSLVVRDNKAGGGQTASDLMRVTVASTGPFSVTAPNTAVSWSAGSSQTVTWNVASSNASPVNCANVNILLSTDGGYTYPITLLANTPNDGSQAITVPNNVSSTCRVKVEAVGNIFYDISNANFSITGAVSCTATTPTGLAASNLGSSTATLNWTAVSGTTYDVNYRVVGAGTWTNVASGTNSLSLTGLTASTQYEAQVRSVCPSSSSAYSSTINFTTTIVQLTYCTANGNSTSDEYIGRVQLNTINNASTAGAGGYSNFTSISTSLNKGTAYTITITPTWTGTSYNEGYGVWIDYNQDGDFADAGETVYTRTASKTTPVSGSFTVPTTALSGATRIRVAMRYNAVPAACGSFNYGEVEDYTVILGGTADTQAPSTPTNLTASGVTQTAANLTWTASTDNVGVTGYNVYVNGTLTGSPTATNYALSGLTAATSYAVTVSARDAAGNLSTAASVNVTTLANTCVNTTLTIKFDNYPEETSWNIKNGSGVTVASGGTYGSQADGSTLVLNNCLPAGCYTFTILDSYGDGICCSYGSGNYSLTNTSTGSVLASGSSFTTSATTNFCVGTSKEGKGDLGSSLEVIELSLYPNPVNDYLNINTNGKDITSVKVYTASGAAVNGLKVDANGVDVSSLKTGVYLISIETEGQVIRKKFVKE